MYALALIRYRRPLEEVLAHYEAHRAYLLSLKQAGTLVASGPLDPRFGGALLLHLPDGATERDLDAVRDGDPYWQAGVAQYELLRWKVGIGREDLDALVASVPPATTPAAAITSEPVEPEPPDEVVVLRHYDAAIEAELARSALEAAGLYAAVWDEDSQLGPVTQGVRLVVRASQREQAIVVLGTPVAESKAPEE
jgi:uncharacterized protein YciI